MSGKNSNPPPPRPTLRIWRGHGYGAYSAKHGDVILFRIIAGMIWWMMDINQPNIWYFVNRLSRVLSKKHTFFFLVQAFSDLLFG